MKVFKWLGIVAVVYVIFVLLFESVFLGMYQPSFESSEGCSNADGQKTLRRDCGIPMIVITTTDDKGESNNTMVARFTLLMENYMFQPTTGLEVGTKQHARILMYAEKFREILKITLRRQWKEKSLNGSLLNILCRFQQGS